MKILSYRSLYFRNHFPPFSAFHSRRKESASSTKSRGIKAVGLHTINSLFIMLIQCTWELENRPRPRYNSANIYHRGLCKECKQSLDKCLRMLVSGKGGSWELTINHHIIILHSSLGGFERKCRSRANFSRRKTWKGLKFKDWKWISCQCCKAASEQAAVSQNLTL